MFKIVVCGCNIISGSVFFRMFYETVFISIFKQTGIKVADSMTLYMIGSLLSLLCQFRWGSSEKSWIAFLFFTVLTVISAMDEATKRIPDELVQLLLLVDLISVFYFPEIFLLERLIGAFSAAGLVFLIVCIAPGAFGGGDIKLLAAGGCFLGMELILKALCWAILSGGVFCIYVLFVKRRREVRFAFGPYLCVAILMVCILHMN